MNIAQIRVYKTALPYVGGAYVWGAGNAIETAIASVVVIDTDAGLTGCGEFTPCGETYNTRSTGIGGPSARDGKLFATDGPGMGVALDYEALGAPVAVYGG